MQQGTHLLPDGKTRVHLIGAEPFVERAHRLAERLHATPGGHELLAAADAAHTLIGFEFSLCADLESRGLFLFNHNAVLLNPSYDDDMGLIALAHELTHMQQNQNGIFSPPFKLSPLSFLRLTLAVEASAFAAHSQACFESSIVPQKKDHSIQAAFNSVAISAPDSTQNGLAQLGAFLAFFMNAGRRASYEKDALEKYGHPVAPEQPVIDLPWPVLLYRLPLFRDHPGLLENVATNTPFFQGVCADSAREIARLEAPWRAASGLPERNLPILPYTMEDAGNPDGFFNDMKHNVTASIGKWSYILRNGFFDLTANNMAVWTAIKARNGKNAPAPRPSP